MHEQYARCHAGSCGAGCVGGGQRLCTTRQQTQKCAFFALCARAIRLHPVSTTQNTPWVSDDKVKKRGRQLWRPKRCLKKCFILFIFQLKNGETFLKQLMELLSTHEMDTRPLSKISPPLLNSYMSFFFFILVQPRRKRSRMNYRWL